MADYNDPRYRITLLHKLNLTDVEFKNAYRKAFPHKTTGIPNQAGHERYCRKTGRFNDGSPMWYSHRT
jgi:hypothetical protein